MKLITAVIATCLAALSAPISAYTPTLQHHQSGAYKHIRQQLRAHSAASRTLHQLSSAPGNDIQYHGGPVMTTPKLQIIYYGIWSDYQTSVIDTFARALPGSSFFNVTALTYYQPTSSGGKQYIESYFEVLPSITLDTYPVGALHGVYSRTVLVTPLTNDLTGIVEAAVPAPDANTLYAVVTDGGVIQQGAPGAPEAGFCSSYCGYHSSAVAASNGVEYKYAFVGNPGDQCPMSCASFNSNPVTGVSPNGDVGIDELISVLSHETEEAFTDPLVNDGSYGWNDAISGEENGDLCAYNYGTTYTDSNGAVYNVHMGGRNYLIQQNWAAPETDASGARIGNSDACAIACSGPAGSAVCTSTSPSVTDGTMNTNVTPEPLADIISIDPIIGK